MNSFEIAHRDISKAAIVWDWSDAPEEFRNLGSPDDADYIAFIPKDFPFNGATYKLEELSCCTNERNKQLDGNIVIIGYHA